LETTEALVKRRTKGGLIVDVFGIEAFLPGSQIDVKPIRDFDVYVEKAIEVKVIKINYTNDNVVVSHKVLIEKDIEEQKAVILNNLEKGQVLEGTIKNMTNFGVFIDLGGVDGLLHITDISWGRINHPEEVLGLDQTVKVVVLDFDEDKRRISLGMKQLTSHPWDSLSAEVVVGSKVKGKIVNVADYGAFLELQPGVEGLIHVSEMSWSQHLRNPQDFMTVGDEVEAVVLTLDRDEHKMSLGIKQLTEDPWTRQDLMEKYAIGTKHKGVVRNLTNFGLFIELEEGIDGLVHVSDLSWTKKIKHPSEFVKVGEEMEVIVLELDATNRRLALSHKHLEENPWDTFETVFT
jgi:small subunit ribosomal protein S1